MKRGELHYDEHVSFLTDRASDDAKATAGDSGWRRSRFRVWIICETCKEMHTRTQGSYIRKDIVMYKHWISREYGGFEGVS